MSYFIYPMRNLPLAISANAARNIWFHRCSEHSMASKERVLDGTIQLEKKESGGTQNQITYVPD